MNLASSPNLGPLGLSANEVESGFIPDIENVATTVIATPAPNGKGWFIRGDTTQGTDLVAKFTRQLYATKNDDIVARHIRLDVTPFFQDTRYAEALLKSSFALYRRIGVSYVELDAVEDGALVWSRLGWSLHGGSIAEVHAEITYVYSEMHHARPPDDFSMPLFGPDILELEDHDGNRIGEEALRRFGRTNREISMRLHLHNTRALAGLRRRGIL